MPIGALSLIENLADPDLLDVYERDGYFGTVRLIIAGEVAAFEFGLDKRGLCFSYTSSGGGCHQC